MDISEFAVWLSTTWSLSGPLPGSTTPRRRHLLGSRAHKMTRTIEAINALWPDGIYPCEKWRNQQIERYFAEHGWGPLSRRTISSAIGKLRDQ
jgi:hypothetical protein